MGTGDETGRCDPGHLTRCYLEEKEIHQRTQALYFFKYLLGTFHVLKTLASLKISRAFLFKYSMCVGLGVVFSPLCLWDFTSLREAQLKEYNSGAAPSFLKLVRRLQKLTWVPGVTEKMVSGDGEARVTLSSIPKQSEMPWGPCLSTLLRSICYLSSSSLGQGQP